jgi:DNA-binding LytR/AlgR family response regulator
MKRLKVLIVEDEMIISESVKQSLLKLNYEVVGIASRYIQALEMLESLEVNLVLIDINLNGLKSGIDLANHIQENYNIPFIYVTANSDLLTFEKARNTRPLGYLVKPFSEENLYSAIEVATYNFFNREVNDYEDFLFVKSGSDTIKLYLKQIVYIQSKQNYLVIERFNKPSISIRGTLSEFLETNNSFPLVKVSRSTAVNLQHLMEVNASHVILGNIKIDYSISYKKEITERWKNYLGE